MTRNSIVAKGIEIQTPPAVTRRNLAKKLLVRVHLWLGLTLGAVWALQGLTGALLVFHRELDQPELPLSSGPRLPLDRLIAAAGLASDGTAEAIGIYHPGSGTLGVTFAEPAKGKVVVLVDASRGTILGRRERTPSAPADGPWRWLYNLHHGLLLGKQGEALLGAAGLILLVAAASGLCLGWPRCGHLRQAFAVSRWRSRLQRLFGWHRVTGLMVAGGLVLLALSGGAMDFAEPLRKGAAHWAAYRAPYQPRPAPVPALSILAERALGIALRRFPDAGFVSLALPSPKAPIYLVRLRLRGEWRSWSGTSSVAVDPANGRILDAYDAAAAPLLNRILESAFAVHSGEVAGWPGRFMVLAAGLALPVLYVSGGWAWWRKRRFGARDRRGPLFDP